MLPLILTLPALLAPYLADETVSGHALRDVSYVLQGVGDSAAAARFTIAFPTEGRIEGEGPCNRFSARQTAPYPWFAVEGLVSTKRACPALAEESAYLEALAAMTLAEASGPVLILSDDTGREMVFRVE